MVKDSQSQEVKDPACYLQMISLVIKMASISDAIELFIKAMLEKTNDVAELQRNELAVHFKCVPSQINYVISTRFTPQNGYIVESKRGGGGFIKIKRITKSNYFMHVLSTVGDSVDQQLAQAFVNNFYHYNVISEREAKIILAALSDCALAVERPIRDALRAQILKNIILNLGYEE